MAEESMLDEAKKETDAEKYKIDNAFEGTGELQDLVGGIEKMAHDDWTEGLFGLVNVGLGAKDFFKDPMETLLGWGFGWLIEHVDFLKEPLDFEQMTTGPGQSPGEKLHDRDQTSIVPEDRSTNYPVDKVPRSGPVTADDGQPFSGQPGTQRISGSLE